MIKVKIEEPYTWDLPSKYWAAAMDCTAPATGFSRNTLEMNIDQIRSDVMDRTDLM